MFCSLLMLQDAEAMHPPAERPRQGLCLPGTPSLHLHHGSLPGFTACLQRHMQSCSNSSNLCRRVGAPCFPKSHRAATGKDQSRHFVESQQLIRLHVNFIPALDLNTPAATSTDNQSTGNQASAGADLLCCLLKNFIPHSQKDKGEVLWFWVCRTSPSIAYNVLGCTHVVNPKAE